MEVLYEIAGVADSTLGARFSLVNNLEDDVITWQVVWTFEDFGEMSVDSTKGAILLSPGNAYGAPVRVVNTQENALIRANGSRTDFTLAAMNESFDAVNTLDIRDVSLNGMRCTPVGYGVCKVPMCSSPVAAFTGLGIKDSSLLSSPSCVSIFCCGDRVAGEEDSNDLQQCESAPLAMGPEEETDKEEETTPPINTVLLDTGDKKTPEEHEFRPPLDQESPPVNDSSPLPQKPPKLDASPPDLQESRRPDRANVKGSRFSIENMLIGAGAVVVGICILSLGAFWFSKKRGKHSKKPMIVSAKGEVLKYPSEVRGLKLSLHPSVSATSTELQEGELENLSWKRPKFTVTDSESGSLAIQTTVLDGDVESYGHVKTNGLPIVSKRNKSQGVFDVDFAKDVVLGTKIGAGAFGSVYQGWWRSKKVAVKMVSVVDAGNCGEKELESLKSEIQVLSRLQHPNIICFYGACLVPPRVCILEELADGSLATLLYREKGKANPLTYSEVLSLGIDISSAMAYLHPTVVHRDLKPQNVLIDDQGRAKVCDFGIAKFKESTFMTTKNVTAGTPAYMAPEMFEGQALTEKVDVFSFAVMMWESITGLAPWAEYDNPMQIIYAVGVQGKRLPIPDDCPHFLRDLIQRSWDREPATRPTFKEILASLKEELRQITFT
ncbi:hypothetical protein BSKO_13325 [Bryopsis sp. KO-2023]|nr:hypothetical protein BSKO_13325 [Bryopsis sp. KO-2023]